MSWWSYPPVPAYGIDKNEISLKISERYATELFNSRKFTILMQMHVHLCKQLPPIPYASKLMAEDNTLELTSLLDARACFKGVNRPYEDDVNGGSVLVYVLPVPATVVHSRSMTCQAKVEPMPSGRLMTAQVRLLPCSHSEGALVDGSLTKIEFVKADPNGLPEGHTERYQQRIW